MGRAGMARVLHTTRTLSHKAAQHTHAYEAHEKPGYGLHPALWERSLLGVGSALGLLVSPRRGDLLTTLTQVSSYPSIDHLVAQMRSTHEGRCLLLARPSLNSQTVDTAMLAELPPHTFGRAWVEWLRANRVGPDGRCDARYMPTYETRYVIQRYRETHDFYHVLLGMPTSTLGETVVKFFEAAHMHLPVAGLSAVGGSLRIINDDVRAWLAREAPSLDTSSLVALAAWAVRLAHR
ncbi:Ubiquinone biosynthesis protein [Malassezia nana]|uniref:4-hydroxy-3-methoxy-5-polyprenylbenzoate decarboxylase n=1 Tax=Malassezia nana TaxID=180528 RepID=A0AAF0ENP1_9BASI|nr:Ubiquinone biosynthesis protein [Malassezia nana]